jgi:hypothetical protein
MNYKEIILAIVYIGVKNSDNINMIVIIRVM